jgi:hypothetical protein
MRKFWAYRHVDGGIHVKAYWETLCGIDPALEDAYDSPFVDEVLEVYEAENRENAENIARDKLKTNTIDFRHKNNILNTIIDD